MELQLKRQKLECLKLLANQICREEQTQEIKLGETMPDIGRVLGAWGQILIRGKQWNNGSIQVSGGVMAWVMYAPEDGSKEQCMEAWLPFQIRCDIPQSQRDGSINVECTLCSIDARTVSARKMMLRANIGVMAQAYEPSQVEIYIPSELPEDIQLLENSYPVRIPREAGEKTFELEEDLQLPATMPAVEQIIYYDLRPEILEQKVMIGKVVFRGIAIVHLLYRGEDGSIYNWDFEVPFSQYNDLNDVYEQESYVAVSPVVTALELEKQEDSIHFRCGMAGQYVVYEQPILKIVEDVYSPSRKATPVMETVEMSVVLDDNRDLIRAEGKLPADCVQPVDISVTFDYPQIRRNGEEVEMNLCASFQTVYYDDEQCLRSATTRWEQAIRQKASADAHIWAYGRKSGAPQGNMGLSMDLALHTCCMSGKGMTMVSAIHGDDQICPDSQRPSLLLRRSGEAGLWDIAKRCGSTVKAIMEANGLTQEPEQGRMLLIPVL